MNNDMIVLELKRLMKEKEIIARKEGAKTELGIVWSIINDETTSDAECLERLTLHCNKRFKELEGKGE